jgi:vancomycin resistance protein VanJ
MTTHTIRCSCGELFHVTSDSIGRKLKCRRCGATTEVRRSQRHQRQAEERARRKPSARAARLLQSTAALQMVLSRSWSRLVAWGQSTFAPATGVLPARPVPRTIVLVSWGYLVMAALLTFVMWSFGDRWWPATILLFIGRWIVLLPLLVLIPAALVVREARRRGAIVPLIVAAMLIAGPFMGIRLGWRTWFPAPAGESMRVVTFNVEVGNPIATVLPLVLDEWNADIVAFQECGPQLAAMVERVPNVHHHRVRGLCLLSNYPITNAEVLDRKGFEILKRDETAGIGGSADVVRYTLTTPAGPIDVTNLHLETPRKGLEGLISQSGGFSVSRLARNTELRDVESHAARGIVDAGTVPRLVLGDFNMPVESRIFQTHWSHLRDAFSVAGTGLGMTKYNGWIRVRIDHVLTDDR